MAPAARWGAEVASLQARHPKTWPAEAGRDLPALLPLGSAVKTWCGKELLTTHASQPKYSSSKSQHRCLVSAWDIQEMLQYATKGEWCLNRFVCSSAKMTQFHYSHLHYTKRLALLTPAAFWGRCMVHHGMAEPGLGLYQLESGELIWPHRTSVLTASLRWFP